MGIIVIVSVSLILGSVLGCPVYIVALQNQRILLLSLVNQITSLKLIVYSWKRAYQTNLTYAVY